MKAPIPATEAQRLQTLRQYEVLDTPPEKEFDDLVLLAAQICQVPTALVSLVDEKRQWFKARHGLAVTETPRDVAFCAHAILHADRVMQVYDARADLRFADNPLVRSEPYIRFYAGAPLLALDGQALGTLCVMDQTPRTLTSAQVDALQALSRLASAQLELRRQAAQMAHREAEANVLLLVAEKSRRALLSVLEDEKLAARSLRASEERFRQLIENASDMIVVIDRAGCIGYQSPSTERLMGYRPDEIRGRSVFELIHPDDRAKAAEGVQRAQRAPEGRQPVEYRIQHRNGLWRIFQSIGQSMTDSAGHVQIVVNSRDITESRQLEEKFLRAQRMEAIGTLASGVAHDLNNILAPVLMVAGLLKDKLVQQEDRDLLTMVERSAHRGASIIGQLLTFSRGIEGSRVSLQVRHLIKEMVQLMQETFPRSIAIRSNVPGDLWNVTADATQIHQVLMNLCVNARDAMPDGGKLRIEAVNVQLGEDDVKAHSPAKPGPYVAITVTDTGIGIPPEIMHRIFDPFFTTKEVGKGTGLGLSTVLGIVKSHEGVLTAYSEPAKGTVFKVYLPASTQPSAHESGAASHTMGAAGNDELILVVDDEVSIRDSIRQILVKNGYRVLLAENGEEAIQAFSQHRGAVRLVLTDLMMPGMGSIALVRALQVLDPTIKIIACSGLADEQRQADLTALGLGETLIKPFTPAQLLQALQAALAAKA